MDITLGTPVWVHRVEARCGIPDCSSRAIPIQLRAALLVMVRVIDLSVLGGA